MMKRLFLECSSLQSGWLRQARRRKKLFSMQAVRQRKNAYSSPRIRCIHLPALEASSKNGEEPEADDEQGEEPRFAGNRSW